MSKESQTSNSMTDMEVIYWVQGVLTGAVIVGFISLIVFAIML